MNKFKTKLKDHLPLKNMIGFSVGTILLFTITTPLVYAFEFAYEKWTPREMWFHYVEVLPVKSDFKKGETLKFQSIASFYKHQDIQWFDTLHCSDGELLTKYKTQVFPENRSEPVIPSESGIDKSKAWQYTEDTPSDEAIECRICGTVVSETPTFGIKKVQDWGCTEWFDVNK